ncbi:hypothetical protein SEA_NIKLAS_95 [Mycobacterium Phage Niklas]|uniref:Uncharacterized protein n=1 Tax=Mycobacterium Phage Niklas TaxID=2517936 RepID=A0A482JCX9_9CAUD|nr:hypothetical protein I5H04_gp08 [Mycobacterium Phage Niklas]ASR85977.1 hypothetical protein SEA_PEANAM_95 [Mycobacterium phage Peanam]QBP31677.1 hypothetical protein SEA_NIKLAS_95 [Mycobacterium Phage Niklas]
MKVLSNAEIARQLVADKARYDKPENRVVVNGEAICRRCGHNWDRLIHGC